MRIILSFLILATGCLAQAITSGMSEADLLKLKGPPQSKATAGDKAIYRWSDAEVTLDKQIVVRISPVDEKREKQAEDRRVKEAAAKAKAKAEQLAQQRQAQDAEIDRAMAAQNRDDASKQARYASDLNHASQKQPARTTNITSSTGAGYSGDASVSVPDRALNQQIDSLERQRKVAGLTGNTGAVNGLSQEIRQKDKAQGNLDDPTIIIINR